MLRPHLRQKFIFFSLHCNYLEPHEFKQVYTTKFFVQIFVAQIKFCDKTLFFKYFLSQTYQFVPSNLDKCC